MRVSHTFHRCVESHEKSFVQGLTYFAIVIRLQMVRRFLKVLGRAGDSQSGLKYSKDRSYSEAPYEHRVAICRASRGTAKTSGCARRSTPGFVFYGPFLAVVDAEMVQVLRRQLKKDAPTRVGAPDGIRAKRSLTTVRLANSRRELGCDYGRPGD
jgi:hypothetical protein